ncbi:MAG TPA: TetR family transcriptional regulator [Flavobacterium sp.]|jgi:AcrR family transcriptional regulator
MNFNDKQIQILQVAERLFADKGFDGTSIRDIAKEAGINIAMVSYYFGSKEKMLESLILYRTSDLKMQLESLISEDLQPLEKINKLVELYIRRLNKNKCIYQIVHTELSLRKRTLNLEAFVEVKRNNLKLVEQIIGEGQKQGLFRTDVNIALLSPTILGTFFNFQTNKPFYMQLLDLKNEDAFDAYIANELTLHIQLTIKALLTYESK